MESTVKASPFLTVAEAAQILRLTPRQTYRLCSSGEIFAVRVGKSWRINREKFLKQIGLDEGGDDAR